ncbi:DNA-protecting protein DprA [Pseudodesulfovibrio sp. F-1]|uniref:DNA-protecting protein DprA n=1 Tax=Pseudodesulfovibrio alkaliphilus TaxID=2661613 RepID=A0A7K1KRV4_9BACT|nr:DNA-processing protein DprA [Pseudodesulfovibrio alkaliphilus]MUM78804.1 DNA-protecting protein DprA [Pseudodesulfovibrio alkaliphilus]
MDQDKEYFACLALRHTPRLGPKVWKSLFSHYSSAFETVQSAKSWPGLELASRPLARDCAAEVWRTAAEEEYRAARRANMRVITWFDSLYPAALREIDDPPCLLYVSGDVSLLANPGVAVVGARECTAMGLEATRRISARLSRIGITIVSGLALGIDRQAHLGGLSGLGSSIAVLGCGLDVDYPYDNLDVRRALDEKGLVVTEFGPGVTPRAGNFPFRNRIISALSLGVLVAEAAHNSGSLITARLAAEQGREVFALPGPLGQPSFTGCHRLIKQGAALVEDAEDIVHILRFDFARELAHIPDLEPDETVVDGAGGGNASGPGKKGRKRKDSTAGKPERQVHEGQEAGAARPRRRTGPDWRTDASLGVEERQLMEVLDGTDRMHIDTLGRTLGWDSPRVSRVLLVLEVRGIVHQLPGMWYLAREGGSDNLSSDRAGVGEEA